MMKKHVIWTFCLISSFSTAAYAQQYCKVGTEQRVNGCEASCTASWSGTRPGTCSDSCTATAPAGYVIMDHGVHVRSESNGGHSVSRIAAEQVFNYKSHIEQSYKNVLDVAVKYNNMSAAGKIKQDMRSALSEAESFQSSHQTVRLSVNAKAHGNFFDQKRGWSNVGVDLRVKCVVPPNLEQQLMTKYALR